jgi:hypothetical protein
MYDRARTWPETWDMRHGRASERKERSPPWCKCVVHVYTWYYVTYYPVHTKDAS